MTPPIRTLPKSWKKKNEVSKTNLLNLIQTNIANELIPSPYTSMMDSTSGSLKYIAKMLKWGRTPTPAEIYSCAKCNTKLTNEENNVHREKGFTVDGKPGLMFNDMENVKAGEKEKQNFQTGKYKVARIICKKCRTILGWKYYKAYVESEKFKVGNFIVAKHKIILETRIV